MAISRNTSRVKVASLINRAGNLRRAQHGYPCRSWSECIEVKQMLSRAREIRLGLV